MFKSVYSKIILIYLIITIVILLATGGVFLGFLDNYVIKERSDSLINEASIINSMTVFYIGNNHPAVKRLYYMNINDASKRINGVIFIIDNTGGVISSDNIAQHLDPGDLNAAMANKVLSGENVVTVGNFGGIFSSTYLTVGTPLRFNGEIVAATYLSIPVPEINRYKFQIFRMFIFAISFAVLISMVISYMYSRKVSKPLKNIALAAKDVANGNFDAKVSVIGSDEIAELGINFNLMLDSLRSLESMRSSFIANVSHELRTPMTTITGFIEGILDNTIAPEEQSKYLHIVLDETKRLARLVSELLTLARIDSGTLQISASEFDINELIRITIIRFEKQIIEKQIEVEIDFEEEQLYVMADKDSISRVLNNLFENALKFNYPGGYIKINTKSSSGKALLSVENSGLGIAPDDLRHIWERFYKTDKSRSHDKKGIGLGLFLVHSIVSSHGEKIWAQSEQDKWTKFTFTLKKLH